MPISQADEMERYIRENQTRDAEVNRNKWWEAFPETIDIFYFMFVAGHFKGNYFNQLERLQRSTGIKGAAVDIKTLLLTANRCKTGELDHAGIESCFFNNCRLS